MKTYLFMATVETTGMKTKSFYSDIFKAKTEARAKTEFKKWLDEITNKGLAGSSITIIFANMI